MFNKYLFLSLVVALILSLFACGGPEPVEEDEARSKPLRNLSEAIDKHIEESYTPYHDYPGKT